MVRDSSTSYAGLRAAARTRDSHSRFYHPYNKYPKLEKDQGRWDDDDEVQESAPPGLLGRMGLSEEEVREIMDQNNSGEQGYDEPTEIENSAHFSPPLRPSLAISLAGQKLLPKSVKELGLGQTSAVQQPMGYVDLLPEAAPKSRQPLQTARSHARHPLSNSASVKGNRPAKAAVENENPKPRITDSGIAATPTSSGCHTTARQLEAPPNRAGEHLKTENAVMAMNRKRWEMLRLDLGVVGSRGVQGLGAGRLAAAHRAAVVTDGPDPGLAVLRSTVTAGSSSTLARPPAQTAQPSLQSQYRGNTISMCGRIQGSPRALKFVEPSSSSTSSKVTSKASESESRRFATTSTSKSTDPLESGIISIKRLSMADRISMMNKPAKKYHVEAVKEQVMCLRADLERTEAMMKKVLAIVEKMESNMKDMKWHWLPGQASRDWRLDRWPETTGPIYVTFNPKI